MSSIELVGLTSGKHLGDDEAAAICPLLTPSTPIGEHPLADSTPPVLAYDVEREPISINTAVLSTLGPDAAKYIEPGIDVSPPIDIPGGGKRAELGASLQSSDSSSSVLHDTSFLTTHHFMNDANFQENGSVKPSYYTFQLGNGKVPEYGFISWNWPLIRKLWFCGLISSMVACLCTVIMFISVVPTSCDPPKEWYQGSLFYEIFPASFKDTNSDGVGDLRGIRTRIPYLKSLQVKAVRLNSIFAADHYPDFYENVKNFSQVDRSIGTMEDMDTLIGALHAADISIVLDLPLTNLFLRPHELGVSDASPTESSEISNIENIMNFWLDRGVDGFYVKGLEHFTSSPFFVRDVSNWKAVLRYYSTFYRPKIMMCSNTVLTKLMHEYPLEDDRLATVLRSFDLVDVFLNVTEPVGLRAQINGVLRGVTFSRMDYPWVHWNVGNVETSRIATRVEALNASLAALFINLMLPGTPSIFYGDEIGLTNIVDHKKEFLDVHHLHQVPPMHWGNDTSFSGAHDYSWIPKGQALMISRVNTISNILEVRDKTPAMYTRGTVKNHEIFLNCAVDRYSDEYLLTVERTYPRRHSVALITNLREQPQTRDLSSIYFGGYVLGGISHYLDGQYLQFHSLTVFPGEALIVKLDK
ncbi:unnamed protein product [Bemisia tabaci]|uniref:Glycosyl hydrolase family 13 catalytic domain-containing protein n=1 Tax=Bemisia tabaci TaxID=7038 RepID=A0A9P0AK56_BEMTA|nr:unnamed protein product [Bemisia tabaci]